jgi:protein CWC15
MSTAARPTYFPAVGKNNTSHVTRHASGKNQTAHTKLKFRQIGQAAESELQFRDFKYELDEKEKLNSKKNKNLEFIELEEKNIDVQLLLKNKPDIELDHLKKYDDSDAKIGNSDDEFESSR